MLTEKYVAVGIFGAPNELSGSDHAPGLATYDAAIAYGREQLLSKFWVAFRVEKWYSLPEVEELTVAPNVPIRPVAKGREIRVEEVAPEVGEDGVPLA